MPENSSPDPGKSLTQRIHSAFSDLPEGERRVADLVLDRPGELAVWTASELAARSGVSNATVSRLFRRLGYDNYDAARQAARRLRERGSPLYLARSNGHGGALAGVLAEEVALVEATLSRLNPVTLREIADSVARAPRVHIAGFRNSHFLADYMTAALSNFRPGIVRMVRPGQTMAESIAAIGGNDLVIIIALRRRPANFRRLVQAISDRGAKVVLLADGSIRESPAYCTWTLSCLVETPQPTDSYLGAMSVLRLLSLEVMTVLGKQALTYLKTVEDLHDRLSELD